MNICKPRLLLAAVALGLMFCNPAARAQQRTNRPPTRLEYLRGTLTPIRTCYDVTRYDLDIRIDPATQSIGGSNKLTFKTVTDFQKMQLDLFSNLDVGSIVFDNGKPATFTRELNSIYVELPETVKKGSRPFHHGRVFGQTDCRPAAAVGWRLHLDQ